jgi:hypothetical protein
VRDLSLRKMVVVFGCCCVGDREVIFNCERATSVTGSASGVTYACVLNWTIEWAYTSLMESLSQGRFVFEPQCL